MDMSGMGAGSMDMSATGAGSMDMSGMGSGMDMSGMESMGASMDMSGMGGMGGGMAMMMPPMMVDMLMTNAPFIYSEMEQCMYMYGAVCLLPMISLQKYIYTRLTR